VYVTVRKSYVELKVRSPAFRAGGRTVRFYETQRALRPEDVNDEFLATFRRRLAGAEQVIARYLERRGPPSSGAQEQRRRPWS
jgi:hypothetical protein